MSAASDGDAVPAAADVVVIGAGPAGSALAALLARRGIDVVLLERDRFPRDKLCGEFLSPEAGRLLEAIGCRQALSALRPPVLTAARFTLSSGFALDVPLPGDGWGLSRLALDAALAAHARASGARLLERTEAIALREADDGAVEVTVAAVGGSPSRERRVLRARLVVAAYGRSNRLDRAPERRFARRRTALIGLKRHLRLAPGAAGAATAAALAGRVEMHLFDGGYCGLTAIETGEVNACMLVTRAFVRSAGDPAWASVVAAAGRANPALGARLGGLAPADDVVHAVAQVSFAFKDRGGRLRLFVGDAAGMIAPLAGDGQAMALEGAVRLADLIVDAFERGGRGSGALDRDGLASAWDGEWRRAFGGRMRLARTLQPVALTGRLAEPAARVVAAVPGAAAWLARRTRG